jgi:hypothetical protein
MFDSLEDGIRRAGLGQPSSVRSTLYFYGRVLAAFVISVMVFLFLLE